MPWKELLRFFASGGVIMVSDDLDLVDVAVRIAEDDKQCIAQWMRENRVSKVSDYQATVWLETDTSLWTIVVSPWILVQQC